MTKREKLRRKLHNNPVGATLQEVETLLLSFGFSLARVSGSHHIYEFEEGSVWRQVILPLHGRKIKAVYVKTALEMIDELFPEEDDEAGEQ